jgi:hypothetical protein
VAFRRAWLFALIGPWSAACSPSVNEAGGGALDATFNEAGTDGQSGCPRPVSSVCATYACDSGLSSAIARACPYAASGGRVQLTHGCDGLNVLTSWGIDMGSAGYFDSVTGNLIAVTSISGSETCVAGPPSFTPPTCPTDSTFLGCGDASPQAACAAVCADTTNPCFIACANQWCVDRSCPDGGMRDAEADGPEAG